MNGQDEQPVAGPSHAVEHGHNASRSNAASRRHALLRLQPATRQTVVKTITTTTIEYAPIAVPRPPSPKLSGDYSIDQKKYPLELALRGEGYAKTQKVVDLRLGGTLGQGHRTAAVYTVSDDHQPIQTEHELPPVVPFDRKGKRKAVDDGTSKRRARKGPVSLHLDEGSDMADTSTSTRTDADLPRKKIRRIQPRPGKVQAPPSLTLDSSLAVLPSPTLSPRLSEEELSCSVAEESAVPPKREPRGPAKHEIARPEAHVEKAVVVHEARTVERHDPVSEDQKHLSLSDGYELATLMSLGSMVEEFTSLPEKMQTHVLYNLLRHSSIPVVQAVNDMIQPALKRNFIADLPSELATQILTYLDAKSLSACLGVSKTWKRFIDAEGKIWSSLLRAEDLWIGDVDKTDEKDAEMVTIVGTRNRRGQERNLKEMLTMQDRKTYMFLKRYKEGVWDEAWDPKVEGRPTSVKLAELRSKKATPKLRRSSTRVSIAKMADQGAGLSSHMSARPFIHPMKLLYKRRKLVKRGWYKDEQPEMIRFPGLHSSVVTCLQFDNDKLVSASDDPAIDIFDTKTGGLQRRLEGHEGGVWALQYIGNILVSGSTDRTLRIWDTDTGVCKHVFYGHTSTVRCLQIIEPVNGTVGSP